MSSLVVKTARITEVKAHPNADRLAVAIINGWQTVVPIGSYAENDLVVYFPPDTLLPVRWTDEFGVTKYCSTVKENPGYLRIRCARLRGEPSFGLIVKADQFGFVDDQDVAETFDARKYEPPVRSTAGDAVVDHPLFIQYTSIENLRHFPTVIPDGTLCAITEKIDGTNCRIGLIDGVEMAGSHHVRRKFIEDFKSNTYWFPWTLKGVTEMMYELGKQFKQVILFGEVHGPAIQGNPCHIAAKSFRAFDLYLDGRYCDYGHFCQLCDAHGIPRVREIVLSEYDFGTVKTLSSGQNYTDSGPREGVVVHPVIERFDPRVGRVILKYINDDVLLDLKREDATDV